MTGKGPGFGPRGFVLRDFGSRDWVPAVHEQDRTKLFQPYLSSCSPGRRVFHQPEQQEGAGAFFFYFDKGCAFIHLFRDSLIYKRIRY